MHTYVVMNTEGWSGVPYLGEVELTDEEANHALSSGVKLALRHAEPAIPERGTARHGQD